MFICLNVWRSWRGERGADFAAPYASVRAAGIYGAETGALGFDDWRRGLRRLLFFSRLAWLAAFRFFLGIRLRVCNDGRPVCQGWRRLGCASRPGVRRSGQCLVLSDLPCERVAGIPDPLLGRRTRGLFGGPLGFFGGPGALLPDPFHFLPCAQRIFRRGLARLVGGDAARLRIANALGFFGGAARVRFGLACGLFGGPARLPRLGLATRAVAI